MTYRLHVRSMDLAGQPGDWAGYLQMDGEPTRERDEAGKFQTPEELSQAIAANMAHYGANHFSFQAVEVTSH